VKNSKDKVFKAEGSIKCPSCGIVHKFETWIEGDGFVKFHLCPSDEVQEIHVKYKQKVNV
jgi:hypothetical protein